MKRLNFALFILAFIALSITGQAQRIMISVAGNGLSSSSGDGLPANQASIGRPMYLTSDPTGNLYLVDGNKIRMVSANGIITTIAGGGSSTAEGIPAASASLNPTYMCTNSAGDLFVVTNNKIRKITATSRTITTYAGTGSSGYGGDGRAASAATFDGIEGICTDGTNLYVVDQYNDRIRKVASSTGIITTFAGTGTWGYSGEEAQQPVHNSVVPLTLAVVLQEISISVIKVINTSGKYPLLPVLSAIMPVAVLPLSIV